MLVEELRSAQPGEALSRSSFSAMSATAWRRPTGHVLSDDRRALEQPLVSGLETVDPRCQHRLDGGRQQDRRHGLAQAVTPALPGEHTVLRQRAHALLEKEGVALGSIDEHLLESRDASRHRRRACRGAAPRFECSGDRCAAGGSTCLTPPVVPVFRSVVDERGESGRSAGGRPGCRGRPGSRSRSSADPRRGDRLAGPGSRAAPGAGPRPSSAADVGGAKGTPRASSSPATSRSEKRAGSATARFLSSARTLPAMLSRRSDGFPGAWSSK